MINLFERKNKIENSKSLDGLESFLDEIWKNRPQYSYYSETAQESSESQKFLEFIYRTNEIKSTKYVGVIHYGGKKLNLLPKIFYDSNKEYSKEDIHNIHSHILWWLSYCRKIKFPNYQTSLGATKSDFFEVLIHLFTNYTRNLLSSSIYQQYQEVSQELPYIKGKLNVPRYISENLSKGNWHKINCTYDSFAMDNKFNRILKHVAQLLFGVSSNSENKKNLREILFILDEVTDERCSAEDCARINFNPMFGEFEIVRDYCQLFLSNSISFEYKNNLKLFAFLLPMEYVFEDFIFGFIEKELNDISVKAQISNTYLVEGNKFNLKPDLWIKTANKSFIADAKYKIIYSDENDIKKGIAQNDLYQMVAYAIRFKVKEIILFYPNTWNENSEPETELIIKDKLANEVEIKVTAFQLPIINRALLKLPHASKMPLNQVFNATRDKLKLRLNNILLD